MAKKMAVTLRDGQKTKEPGRREGSAGVVLLVAERKMNTDSVGAPCLSQTRKARRRTPS